MKKILCILSLSAAFLMAGEAATAKRAPESLDRMLEPYDTDDDYGVLTMAEAETYDSLLSVWYKNNIEESYDKFASDFIDIDLSENYNPKEALPDSIYKARLDMLVTAVQLPYNPIVKQYIMRYTIKYRSMMSRILGLAQYYMPIFEEELDKGGLPEELKIMPIIESVLNPTIHSRAGAAGMWQFMLRTGKSYGLESNTFVDERYDPVKSTQAACRLLKDYYRLYGDWTLVIAAYNCGPGNVNKAIKRVPGAKTYWDIYEYLPKETRGYIPSFIGMTYAYTFHKAHGIEPVAPPHPIVTDTLHVNRMLHFGQISSTVNIPIEVIRDLNPQYKMDIIPAKEKTYTLVLPVKDISSFIEKEQEIYGKDTLYLQKYIGTDLSALNIDEKNAKAPTKGSSAPTGTTYKVKNGDNLGSIAAKYHVTVKQLMQWNGISDPRKLRAGQTIKVK
ncbi:MAG: transglycosylase SLT domain-containing protein [Rikenellaceae bacterium]|nr:transglycosylase SLT domain-containing protein [Rikenellaceae bacterium]